MYITQRELDSLSTPPSREYKQLFQAPEAIKPEFQQIVQCSTSLASPQWLLLGVSIMRNHLVS
jgi:hypothetical protein